MTWNKHVVYKWAPQFTRALRIRHHSLPLRLHLQQFRCPPLRSLSQELQGLHELRKIHPLPFLHQHTNERTLASSTSNQTCGRCGKTLQRWRLNC